LWLIIKNFQYYSIHLLNQRPEEEDAFDRRHGTDTARIREIGSLSIDSANAVHAVRYEPTAEAVALQALSSIPTDVRSFSFVDYGCGKGKILLLASAYPYRSLIGLDFAPELVEVARRNVEAFERAQERECRTNVLCAEAGDFDPPEGNLVAYFYNPFGRPVMEKVEEQLRQAAIRCDCDMFVIYVNPVHRHVWQDKPHWQIAVEGEGFTVYRNRRPA